MDLQLADKTVLVAWAGQGLGQDAARGLRPQPARARPDQVGRRHRGTPGARGPGRVHRDRLPITPSRLWELMS